MVYIAVLHVTGGSVVSLAFFSFCRVIYRPCYRTTLEEIWGVCVGGENSLHLFLYCKLMALLLLNAIEFIACVLYAMRYPLSSDGTV